MFFSFFFFFFLSFRDTCIEGGEYEGMSSGLQFYLKLIEWKKKGGKEEKRIITTWGEKGNSRNFISRSSTSCFRTR